MKKKTALARLYEFAAFMGAYTNVTFKLGSIECPDISLEAEDSRSTVRILITLEAGFTGGRKSSWFFEGEIYRINGRGDPCNDYGDDDDYDHYRTNTDLFALMSDLYQDYCDYLCD